MNITTKEMVTVSLFAALSILAAMFSKYGGDAVVPFSLMPIVAMLAGSLLGARLGALSILIYVLIGLVGVPVFAKPPYGGPAYLLLPTAGFLFGFILAAYVIGKMVEASDNRGVGLFIRANLVGLVAIYLVGLPYLYLSLNYYVGASISVSRVIEIGFIPFIGFDLVKAVLSAVLASKIFHRIA